MSWLAEAEAEAGEAEARGVWSRHGSRGVESAWLPGCGVRMAALLWSGANRPTHTLETAETNNHNKLMQNRNIEMCADQRKHGPRYKFLS